MRTVGYCDHNKDLYFVLPRATTGSYMLMKVVHQNSTVEPRLSGPRLSGTLIIRHGQSIEKCWDCLLRMCRVTWQLPLLTVQSFSLV